ncbi:Ribonuclease H-like protein [Metarhizium guizhouense ARSEF 977]|uniref:Ribonuclease H-like protein n=1 Tax=Metarhizium guizhouense (strain ARSEF 977) TaxID=1276136 RepID=A0A0B4GBZ3_METGA|nr:Ribonuclease H-like protein [Metarhizium guizhouense ARSEF 977]KID81753.1 Ribonuclease H-like protein [Metarhizium guizhouense ARSEF 977]KID84390.1 Ribonuclease H-like protein [Metarhizium guizhouense ARSEF 977]
MSSIGDLSGSASGCGSRLDDSDLNLATSSSAASSSSNPSAPRHRTSPIWQYCRLEEGRKIPAAWVDSNGRKWWHCQPCFDRKKRDKKYNCSGGSSTVIDHLRKQHGILVSKRQDIHREATESRLGDISSFLSNETLTSTKRRKVTAEEDALDQATLRELYCRYTVACSLPFAQVEHPAFRDFIRYLRPAADDLLPRSGDTVKTDLQWGYDNKKEFVKRALQNALSSIHIIPDNWTSPNVPCGVRIKELEGEHSGEHMAEAIMEFIREYGIATKVGYFMMDNASNMNTMIDEISDDLEREFDVFYDPLPHRLRCTGHVIHLAVMEFLIGKRPPTTGSYGGPSEEEIEEWRKRGAIGKLHNIVVYITWTPQRLQTFTALTDGLRLRRDNDTRWNSWYQMVERALRPKVRQAITVFCAQEPALQEDALTPSDWVALAEIHKFLEPFHDATMANEGVQNSIADVLPTMDYILHHIEASREATTIPHLATMMETAWAKLADYYELTEDSPVYSAATVLNPSFKWAYMEKTWEDKTEWIERAKSRVGQLWRESYKSTSSLPVLRPGSAEEPTTRRLNGYKMWMNEQKATIFNTDDDEYEVYCREPVVMTSDPLKWWLELAQRKRFPGLSLMAIDILSIAAMSSGTERLFSKSKLTITDQRGAMDAETLNLVECLRSWDSSALIVPSDCRYVDAAGCNPSDALGRDESGGGSDTVEMT